MSDKNIEILKIKKGDIVLVRGNFSINQMTDLARQKECVVFFCKSGQQFKLIPEKIMNENGWIKSDTKKIQLSFTTDENNKFVCFSGICNKCNTKITFESFGVVKECSCEKNNLWELPDFAVNKRTSIFDPKKVLANTENCCEK